MNTNKLLTLIVILLASFLASCSNEQGDNWVIFSEGQSRQARIAEWYAEDGQSTGYWQPARTDVLIIMDGAAAFLQSNSESFHTQGTPVWERLDEYMVQFFGITLDDRRIVYANYFCTDTERDWRKEFIMVMDGGQCFFQFMYDADTGEFFNLRVNGEA